jgi:CRISPR/Cas system-associated exonuclease Cas4 (RecB family)
MNEIAQRIKSLFLNFDKREREDSTIYVSDLTSCMRRAFFNIYFNAQPKPTPAMLQGKLFHVALEKVLKSDESFSSAEFEVECSHDLGNGWKLKGRADVVTDEAIYEFKFAKGTKYNQASTMYFAQLSAYLKMIGRQKGYLVLVDRGTFNVDVLEVSEIDDLWNVVLQDANILIDHLQRGSIPIYRSPLFSWECQHCAWNIICSNLREVKANGASGKTV